ncbi:MAG: phosphate signaling complex PhoU family protein [Gaiellales bacterium]
MIAVGELAERDLNELRSLLAEEARLAVSAVTDATSALVDWHASAFESTLAAEAAARALYLRVDHDVESFIAAHEANGDQLRQALTILHINRSVERAAHNAARVAHLATPPPRRALPEEAVIADALRAMGSRGAEMIRTSIDMFERRDVNAVQLLSSLDEVLDRENEKIVETVMGIDSIDVELRQWAMRMMFAGRWLERIGDHAVNIAERVTSMGPTPGQSLKVTGW